MNLLLLAVLVVTAHAQTTIYGNGSIFFSYLHPRRVEGVQIVYKPENGIANLIDENEDKFAACIVFLFGLYQIPSHRVYNDMRAYLDYVSNMLWSKEGQYLYATAAHPTLRTDRWAIYEVMIYNRTSSAPFSCWKVKQAEAFYIEALGAYRVPEKVAYCRLEKDEVGYIWNDTKCSLVMNGTSPGDFLERTYFPPLPIHVYESPGGQAVLIPVLVIVGIMLSPHYYPHYEKARTIKSQQTDDGWNTNRRNKQCVAIDD